MLKLSDNPLEAFSWAPGNVARKIHKTHFSRCGTKDPCLLNVNSQIENAGGGRNAVIGCAYFQIKHGYPSGWPRYGADDYPGVRGPSYRKDAFRISTAPSTHTNIVTLIIESAAQTDHCTDLTTEYTKFRDPSGSTGSLVITQLTRVLMERPQQLGQHGTLT
jgi:hypothetical protein